MVEATGAGVGVNSTESLKINRDSQICIALINNQRSGGRTKHMDIKYHFIKDEVLSGRVNLMYHPTTNNIADLMTKQEYNQY